MTKTAVRPEKETKAVASKAGKPAKPVKAGKPAMPVKAGKPAKPVKAGKPAKPVKAGQPAKAAKGLSKKQKAELEAAAAAAPSTSANRLRFGVSLLMALAATMPAFMNALMGRTSLTIAAARFLAIAAVAYVLTRVLAAAFSPRVKDGTFSAVTETGPVPVGR